MGCGGLDSLGYPTVWLAAQQQPAMGLEVSWLHGSMSIAMAGLLFCSQTCCFCLDEPRQSAGGGAGAAAGQQ